MKIQLPIAFEQSLQQLFAPTQIQDFIASLQAAPITSIRLNPFKNSVIGFENSPVAWCTEGKYLPQRPDFTAEPSFWAGAYYVQEASSMFVGYVMQQLLPPSAVHVLDLCAAPAGKSTHLSSILPPDSLLVSNEVIKPRANILMENLQRWGLQNHLVSNNDATSFAQIQDFFDFIIVDAPCSGEGMFRKDNSAIEEWSTANVNLCATRQRRIIADALPSLKKGGYLLYSTCTYNQQENEENVKWLCDNHGLVPVDIQIDNSWGICSMAQGCYRFFPHLTAGEGFFLACLRRKGESHNTNPPKVKKSKWVTPLPKKQLHQVSHFVKDAVNFEFVLFKDTIFAIPQKIAPTITYLTEKLVVKTFGVEMGALKHDDLVPAQALAMNTALSPAIQQIELSKEQAVQYLKKVDFQLATPLRGWTLATYEGLGLGWLKILPNRFNNYYPTEWRIRKDIVLV